MSDNIRYVISVMAADKPGIVAAISGAIFQLKGNIVALSQTVLEGYFTIILVADFPHSVTAESLQQKIETADPEGQFNVIVCPYQQIFLPKNLQEGTTEFVLTARGKDRRGIIYRISKTLADKGINILDIATYLEGNQFVLIIHLLIPAEIDVWCLQDELMALSTPQNFSLSLQHIDTFKETNRV